MYPNLYFAFKDLFGVEWRFLSFINSFGFFVALGFIAGAIVLTAELRRKAKEGLLDSKDIEIIVGKPATTWELVSNFLIGFFLGFKFVGLFFAGETAADDPQSYIFSSQGNWPAGLLLGAFFAWQKWREKNKQKLAAPEKRSLRVWPHDRVGEIIVIAVVLGLAGAKLFDIFENWSDFLERPSEYIFSPAGLTFYGGLISAALGIWYFAKKNNIRFWPLNDAMAPTMILAYAVGRIGCQVAGDGDWGIVNTNPKPFSWLPDWMWAYTYPNNVNEAGNPIPGCIGKYCNELPQPVYPTPLYEVVVCLILFGVLWSLRKKIKVPGRLFAVYLMLNGAERFFIEKIRVNTRLDIFGFHPTQAEVISTLLFLCGLFLWFFLGAKKQPGSQASQL